MEYLRGVRIMHIRSGNGSEFMNKRVAAVCRNYGIAHKKMVGTIQPTAEWCRQTHEPHSD